MKAILASLLVLFALAAPAAADPAIWEARDADSRIVLFGSVHMMPRDLEWRTPLLDEAMTASEQVYFETDVGPRGFLALTVKMTLAAFQSASAPWLDRLTPEQREQLRIAVEPLGMTLEAATTMPPWLLSMQLAGLQLSGEDTGAGDYEFDTGVEWVLQWDLVPDRKAYFETPGEQFDLLAAGTLEEQIDGLFALLNETADTEALAKMIAAWASGDVDAIAALVAPKNEAEQAAVDMLLLARNRNWMPTIERLLAENRENLVVVGAAHLSGEGSVLDLLEEAGYTVTRIQ
jgi:uncharacterized protein YbaP (TraB family)